MKRKYEGRFTLGGHLREVPKPHVRWYDDKRRKPVVKITVYGYWGIGRHYIVTLKGDGNGIWNRETKSWQECWDDPKAKGETFTKRFDNMVLATLWIEKMMKKHFRGFKKAKDWHNLVKREDQKMWFGIFKVGD